MRDEPEFDCEKSSWILNMVVRRLSEDQSTVDLLHSQRDDRCVRRLHSSCGPCLIENLGPKSRSRPSRKARGTRKVSRVVSRGDGAFKSSHPVSSHSVFSKLEVTLRYSGASASFDELEDLFKSETSVADRLALWRFLLFFFFSLSLTCCPFLGQFLSLSEKAPIAPKRAS